MLFVNVSDQGASITVSKREGHLTVSFPVDVVSDSFFKIKLARFLDGPGPRDFLLKEGLSAGDIRNFEDNLQKFAQRMGLEVTEESGFTEHVATIEDHVRERRRVGADIKRHVPATIVYIDDFREVVDRAMVRPLREQQMWDAYFMCVMGRVANFSVPGSGKTASVYGMYAYLKHKGMADKVLVISPINSFGAWIDEYRSCFGRSPAFFSIQDRGGMSASAVERFLRYDSGGTELFLFNYESLIGYGDMVRESVVDDRTLVVLDEVHRIKAVNGSRAKATMSAIQNACLLVAMTGTPIPNSYLDLYNLMNMIFRSNYRDMVGLTPSQLSDPMPKDVVLINEGLYPFYCRTDKDSLGVPPANPDIIVTLDASEAENRLFTELMYALNGQPLALIVRTLQMESDPDMLLKGVDEDILESLGVEYRPMGPIDITVPHIESTKVRFCVDYVTDLVEDGKSVIVWCMFVRSIEKLSSMLEERGIGVRAIYGAVPVEERQRLLDGFKEGEYKVLVANPHTLAESISLHTVCHDAVYFEYGYNLVHLLQSKDRIHRLGLPEGQYTQYHFIQLNLRFMNQEYSLDDKIYSRLKHKEKLMLNAIANRELEIMPSDEDDIRAVLGPLFRLRSDVPRTG